MKKIFTQFSMKLAIVFCALVSCLTVNADDVGAYAIKFAATSYPSGAGKVYVSFEKEANPEANSSMWKNDVATVEETTMFNSQSGYIYGLGNEGWHWTGVAVGVKDAEGKYVPLRDEEGNIVCQPKTKNWVDVVPHSEFYETDDEALANMPEEPDTMAFAVFGRVVPECAPQMALLGSVSMDNLINNIGEKVNLTATPKDSTCTFAYWTKNDPVNGEKFTENPLEVNVTESAVYYAHFNNDVAIHFNGDEGYIIWYNDTTYQMPGYVDINDSTVMEYAFNSKNFVEGTPEGASEALCYYKKPDEGNYTIIGGYPHLLKVNGPSILKNSGSVPTLAILLDPYSATKFTGKDGLDTDFVEAADGTENYFYLLDLESMTFKKTDDYILPANQLALVLNSSSLQKKLVPNVVYTTEQQAQEATSINKVGISKAIINGKVYNLNGVQMVEGQKGVYIMNGKKYIK